MGGFVLDGMHVRASLHAVSKCRHVVGLIADLGLLRDGGQGRQNGAAREAEEKYA